MAGDEGYRLKPPPFVRSRKYFVPSLASLTAPNPATFCFAKPGDRIQQPRTRKNESIWTRFFVAGDEGFEPPITGPEPVALPLGQSPINGAGYKPNCTIYRGLAQVCLGFCLFLFLSAVLYTEVSTDFKQEICPDCSPQNRKNEAEDIQCDEITDDTKYKVNNGDSKQQ